MTITHPVGPFADLELFADCPAEDLDRLAEAVTRTFIAPEGAVLCRQGDAADCWWIIEGGAADITVDGRYVATVGAGESVGELALLDGGARAATVTAVSDLTVHEVDGTAFTSLVAGSGALAFALLGETARRLRAANLQLAPPLATPEVTVAAPEPVPVPDGPGTVVWDPLAPGYATDPYPQFAALREAAPVHHLDLTQSWLVTRYEDVREMQRERTMSVRIQNATRTPAVEAELALIEAQGGRGRTSMLRQDGEDHTRLRRLVSRAFTPKAVKDWRERTEEIVDRLLDEVAERGEIDALEDYALPLPCQVISEMLGMPIGDIPTLRGWSDALVKALDPIRSPDEEAAAVAAGTAFYAYLAAVIEDKRQAPGDDILSMLISAEEDGDRLSHAELIDQVSLLYVAGHETTVSLITNGLNALLDHPDQLRRLQMDPSLDANAIEECLRYDSPVVLNRRITTEDLTIGDVAIPAGSVLSLLQGAANRDPRHFGPTAGAFDITRPGANEHVSLGGGAHHCLGAALTRLEAQVALPALIRRFPDIDKAGSGPVWLPRVVFRAMGSLPVSLG